MWRRKFSYLLLSASVFGPVDAVAKPGRKTFAGPVAAEVVEVIDGDTFLADAEIWPGQTLRVNIRVRGIDAPEMKAVCASEREAAAQAREALVSLIGGGPVSLSNIGGAKYYGRVLADVSTEAGAIVSTTMLDAGLVRGYSGGRRQGWCG